MPKFRFSMESVLKVRTHNERECLLVFSQCEHLRQQAAERLQLAREDERIAQEVQRDLAATASDAEDLRSLRQQSVAIRAIRARVAQLEDELGDAVAGVERARDLLAEAAKERMAIEQLRDRRKSAWLKELQHKETLQIDDAVQALRAVERIANASSTVEESA
ncbi:MAG: flagellar FliJ family protein [Phycisphaeraceae bacterium]|nr:flagellar FliJ family protein [Phycisphaerales bacterium]MCB9860540.1 flagellar FliJ family protein [Phycisphaeraceae bacterium]